jgi:hypothetical protein
MQLACLLELDDDEQNQFRLDRNKKSGAILNRMLMLKYGGTGCFQHHDRTNGFV